MKKNMINLIILFFISPILGFLIVLFLYFTDRNKKSLFYSLIMGMFIGLISYYFIPNPNYDLVSHHRTVENLTNVGFDGFMNFVSKSDLEIVPAIYSYFISFFHNVNLLQFFIVSGGYTLIFYMLYDYRKIYHVKSIYFIPIFLFTFFSFQHLYFISGLYFYFAIILFAFTLYCDYIKNGNKVLCFLLYVLTMFIHSSLILPFIILIIYKVMKHKIDIKIILLIFAIFFSLNYVLSYLSNTFDIKFINMIYSLYSGYVKYDYHYKTIYSGNLYFIEISKLIIINLVNIMNFNFKKEKMNGYILILSLFISLLLTQASISCRFCLLIGLIGIIPMVQYLSNNEKNGKGIIKLLIFLVIILFSAYYSAYYFKTFINKTFDDLLLNLIFNFFGIFGGLI